MSISKAYHNATMDPGLKSAIDNKIAILNK